MSLFPPRAVPGTRKIEQQGGPRAAEHRATHGAYFAAGLKFQRFNLGWSRHSGVKRNRARTFDTFSGDLFIMRSRCFRAIKSARWLVGPLVGACYDRVINVPRKSYRVASFEFVIFCGTDPHTLPRPPWSLGCSLSTVMSDNKKAAEIARRLTTRTRKKLCP